MATTSGLAQRNGRPRASKLQRPAIAGYRRRCITLGTLAISGFLLACGTQPIPSVSSVELSSDRQALLVTCKHQATCSHVTLQRLPAESTIAPGLYFNPQQFDQVRLSPDGRYAAFSTVGHHSLVGLLDLATMVVREIDIITEGEVMAFHWAVDSRTLAYDYLPASGYRRVRAYDAQLGEALAVPRIGGNSTVHITVEKWGEQPGELVLSVTDMRSNRRWTDTINLVPHQ